MQLQEAVAPAAAVAVAVDSIKIRRSSRSVCSNIAEGYRKRIYPKHFRSKISDADGETSDPPVGGSLDFSKDCKYINIEIYEELNTSMKK